MFTGHFNLGRGRTEGMGSKIGWLARHLMNPPEQIDPVRGQAALEAMQGPGRAQIEASLFRAPYDAAATVPVDPRAIAKQHGPSQAMPQSIPGPNGPAPQLSPSQMPHGRIAPKMAGPQANYMASPMVHRMAGLGSARPNIAAKMTWERPVAPGEETPFADQVLAEYMTPERKLDIQQAVRDRAGVNRRELPSDLAPALSARESQQQLSQAMADRIWGGNTRISNAGGRPHFVDARVAGPAPSQKRVAKAKSYMEEMAAKRDERGNPANSVRAKLSADRERELADRKERRRQLGIVRGMSKKGIVPRAWYEDRVFAEAAARNPQVAAEMARGKNAIRLQQQIGQDQMAREQMTGRRAYDAMSFDASKANAQLGNERAMAQLRGQDARRLAEIQTGSAERIAGMESRIRGDASAGQRALEEAKLRLLQRAENRADSESALKSQIAGQQYGIEIPRPGSNSTGASAVAASPLAKLTRDERESLGQMSAVDIDNYLKQSKLMNDWESRKAIIKEFHPNLWGVQEYDPDGLNVWDVTLGSLVPAAKIGEDLWEGRAPRHPLQQLDPVREWSW